MNMKTQARYTGHIFFMFDERLRGYLHLPCQVANNNVHTRICQKSKFLIHMHVVTKMWLKTINVKQYNSWYDQIPTFIIFKTHQASMMLHVGASVYLKEDCFSLCIKPLFATRDWEHLSGISEHISLSKCIAY